MPYWSEFLLWCRQGLLHHRLRTGLIILEIGIGMTLLVSVLGFSRGYENVFSGTIDRMGYQFLVTARGYPYDEVSLFRRGPVVPRYLEEQVAEEIATDESVAETSRFFQQIETDPRDQRLQLYLGIDDKFLRMKPWIEFQNGEWFRSDRAHEIILGYEVAWRLRCRLGDTVMVLTQPFTVRGVFDRTGSLDDGTIFLPLTAAQKLFDRKGKITGIGIRLKDPDDYLEFSEKIFRMPSTQLVTLTRVQNTIRNLTGTARGLMAAGAMIGLIIAGIGITSSVLVAMLKHLPEIRPVRAIGGRRRNIFIYVWGEALLLSLLGVLAGGLMSFGAAEGCEVLLRRILPFSPEGPLIQVTPGEVLQAGAGVIILGIVAGLYPAFHATVLRPGINNRPDKSRRPAGSTSSIEAPPLG